QGWDSFIAGRQSPNRRSAMPSLKKSNGRPRDSPPKKIEARRPFLFADTFRLDSIRRLLHPATLSMSDSPSMSASDRRYTTGELVRRLLALAWQFRVDCVASLVLSLMLLLLGLLGLQLLGVVVDVIRHALDPAQRAPVYPWGWTPPAHW